MDRSKPIYSVKSLYRMCNDLKNQGKRIGLTHGAFDLFHYSHLDLLQKAAAVCDFLIVGIDNDESISKYKSYTRPIVNERQRLGIVNELSCVDAVFIKDVPHDDESHIKLYKDLLTDYIIIGSKFDSRFKENIYNEAESIGVRLIEINAHQDPTTTSIVNKIVERYSSEQYEDVPKSNY
ncbi:adenylyltransferase/cytidyltransferase family protein [Patescibacteria group bacterium]